MDEVLSLVVRFLDFECICNVRLVCKSFFRNDALCEIFARHHHFFRAWMSQHNDVGMRCVTSGEWFDVTRALTKMVETFWKEPVSISDFSNQNKQLGDGPMSVVDLFYHSKCDCFVALKCYSKQTLLKMKKTEEAFVERDMIRTLHHPNIITLLCTFQTHDCVFFALEYCPFGDLVDEVRKQQNNRLSVERCVSLLSQLSKVLAFIHAKNVIHRDVKCENILLGCDGNIRLIDFATAYKVGEKCDNLFVGSPQYIAPEIIKGGKTPTDKVDIFGLGELSKRIFLLFVLSHETKGVSDTTFGKGNMHF